MASTWTDPITAHWHPPDPQPTTSPPVTAQLLSQRLGQIDIADIDPLWLPEMAAAATELAQVAGIELRLGHDDPPVALLRLIARATLARPDAAGPNTTRLFELIG